jgi:membrane-associated phospholipid phosphatase
VEGRFPEPAAVALAVASFLVFTLLYGITSEIGHSLYPKYRLHFAWESRIPLVPAAAVAYLSVGLMIVPILRTFPTFAQLWPVAVTLAAQQSVAAAIFLIFPLQGGYPKDPPGRGLWGGIWELSNSMALSHNWFPSLHVALSSTAVLVLWRAWGRVPWGMIAWALLVSLSTLFVHQHHLADIAGGMALAWASVRLVFDRMGAVQAGPR